MTDDVNLPPLPHLPLSDPAAAYKAVHDYAKECATAAIEPYAKRIAELESQLDAIGAGGVTQGQRLIKAERHQRGELFMYLRTLNGKPDWSEDCVADCESDLIHEEEMYAEGYWVMPLYVAPQPAEPAQEPSDDIDIKDVREYLDAWGCLAHPGVVALLARYGSKS